MNARWVTLLAVSAAVLLVAQVGIAAPSTLPAPSHSQMGQTQATTMRATSVNDPCRPLPPCPQPCPCYFVSQVGSAISPAPPAPGQGQMGQTQATMVRVTSVVAPCPQPCGNVAPWSWQHENQNDNEWPADHGG